MTDMGRIMYQMMLMMGDRISKYITLVTIPSPLRGLEGLKRLTIV